MRDAGRHSAHAAAPSQVAGRALTLTVALVTFVPAAARAEGLSDPRCAGLHSLFDPLPDACLEVIDTDRPHQTDTPHVVAAGHSQFESAVVGIPLGGTLGAPPGQRAAHLVFLEDNYKFGLFSHVDLQLLFKHADYDLGAGRFVAPGPLSARIKINFIEEKGFVPAVTLVPWIFVPMAPSETLRGGPLLFWGWELPYQFELEVNAGVLFGESPKPLAAPVFATALTRTLVGEFRIFIDVYTTGGDAALGTGALWAFTRDLQVDLGTYIGLHGDEPVATPFVGFSFRR